MKTIEKIKNLLAGAGYNNVTIEPLKYTHKNFHIKGWGFIIPLTESEKHEKEKKYFYPQLFKKQSEIIGAEILTIEPTGAKRYRYFVSGYSLRYSFHCRNLWEVYRKIKEQL